MISTVITRGYGNGTFSGTIPLVVLRGYSIGAAITATINEERKKRVSETRSLELVELRSFSIPGEVRARDIQPEHRKVFTQEIPEC